MQTNYSLLDVEAFCSRYYIDPNSGAPRPLLITPYEYPVVFATLATGTTQTLTVNISAIADFVLLGLSHRATVGAEVDTISDKPAPQVNILLTDSGSGEQYMNVATDIENYSSNGQYVRGLPYPRIISGKTTLQVQVANYGAETYSYLKIALQGVQVRAYSQ